MSETLFKRIMNWATSIAVFRTGDVIPVDGPSGTAKMSAGNLLRETAQNALAGNMAPAFDPTRTSENPYKADEYVIYSGELYVTTTDHYGPWDASHFYKISADLSFAKIFNTGSKEYYSGSVLYDYTLIKRFYPSGSRIKFKLNLGKSGNLVAIKANGSSEVITAVNSGVSEVEWVAPYAVKSFGVFLSTTTPYNATIEVFDGIFLEINNIELSIGKVVADGETVSFIAGNLYIFKGGLFRCITSYTGTWDYTKFYVNTISEEFCQKYEIGSHESYSGTIASYDYSLIKRFYKANKRMKFDVTVSASCNLIAVSVSGSSIIITGLTSGTRSLMWTPSVDIKSIGFWKSSTSAPISVSLEVTDGLIITDGVVPVFSDLNFGVAGDSITSGQNQNWSRYCDEVLGFKGRYNVAVSGAMYACRKVTYGGVTYEPQNYDDPDFAGISNDTPTDAISAQKLANNCAKVHIQKFISNVTAGTYGSPDIFCFAYGTNDNVSSDAQLSSAIAVTTPSGEDLFNMACGMRWCVEKIKTTYPGCRIFVLLPIQHSGDFTQQRNAGNLLKIPQIKKVAEALAVPVIDMWSNCGIAGILESGTGPYLSDGLHPNVAGQKLMGAFAAEQIIALYGRNIT